MEWESVQELKVELRRAMVKEARARARYTNQGLLTRTAPKVAKRARSSRGAQVVRANATPSAKLALGVAKGKTGFALAIRTFDTQPITNQMARLAREKARGEAELVHVGRVFGPRTSAPSAPYNVVRRPLLPGYSVGHINVTAGTIGAFVEHRGEVHILSNSHVLADSGKCSKGDAILQPGILDGGSFPAHHVGALRKWIPFQRSGNKVDAAVSTVFNDLDYRVKYGRRTLRGFNEEPDLDDVVWKIGRTTGLSRGKVTALDLDDLSVDYDGTLLSFGGQLEIRAEIGPFSDGGDSGSLIIDDDNWAVGLLFAGTEDGVTYANPVGSVLSSLSLSLIT